MEGGGWCSSVANCHERSKTDLGSSLKYPKVYNLEGNYFSTNKDDNPLMYNWNAIYIKYCDGGSFSGDNETATEYNGEKLYFRGKRILQAVRDDLIENRGLNKATDIVISGCRYDIFLFFVTV